MKKSPEIEHFPRGDAVDGDEAKGVETINRGKQGETLETKIMMMKLTMSLNHQNHVDCNKNSDLWAIYGRASTDFKLSCICNTMYF